MKNNDNGLFDSRRKRKPAIDISTMVYGKVPPQAKDLEEAVLGAILLDKRAFELAAEVLKPESFYVDANQRIFKACQQLDLKNKPIDILTVTEQLKFTEELDMVGGPYYVTKLTNAVVGTANIEAHAEIVVQKFIARELIRISGETIGDAYEDGENPYDILDRAEQSLTNIVNGNTRNKYTSLSEAVLKTIIHTEKLRSNPSHITGVPSGFDDLDRITHGWQNSDLVILAARPSVGKTAFALNLARNGANTCPVGVFSLEMSELQLTQRLLSTESGIWLDNIISGQLDDEQMNHMRRNAMQGINIYIDDTPGLNIFELRAKARRWHSKHGIRLLIIDYLQLMTGLNERNQNREQEIAQISRSLKGLAKELNIPVIALSQLSRAVETRHSKDKMPQLSDLRESGSIEQDADMVMFMYRPEYYDITTNENGESTKGETHIKIAKHRNGALDTVKLTAKLHIQKFVQFEHSEIIPVIKPVGNNWKPYKDDTLESQF